MAYEARKNDAEKEYQKARSDANNANNIRNAADVAIATGHPVAAAAGGAVKFGDKLTGGKVSDAAGKALTNANKFTPGGKLLQGASNKLNESGASDLAGNVARIKNGLDNGPENSSEPIEEKLANQKDNPVHNQPGRGQDGSLPSSVAGEQIGQDIKNSMPDEVRVPKDPSFDEMDKKRNKDGDKKNKDEGGNGSFFGTTGKVIIFIVAIPLLLIFGFILMITILAGSFFGSLGNLFGISYNIGSNIGDINYTYESQDQQDFFDRVSSIQKEYESKGSSVDTLKIVAVYDVLNMHGANISYEDMTDSSIREIVNSMLLDGMYDEETFRKNLISTIIPKYIPDVTDEMAEEYADQIFEHVKNYRNLVGEDENIDCSSTSCTYNIKGYVVDGKGNIDEKVNVSNLYVRLMQCGSSNGHDYGGTFGQPLDGEELVPFETYVLGVASMEVDTSMPAEAIKAQIVATRSFILARHASFGDWRTLKQEDGKWVLQVAACSQDQVYCDPNQGCSSNSLQWGQIHSGLDHNTGFSKQPLSGDNPLRTYVTDTKGELLVNRDGYIIYSGYSSAEKSLFSSLASDGLTYQQILLQVYNQGTRNYGASSIKKSSCGVTSDLCSQVASGDFVNWKQYQGPWIATPMGTSGKTIKDIGCLVTSVSMLIAKSGEPTTISNFNPGSFVQFLNTHGGINSFGNYQWYVATKAVPTFQYRGQISLLGMSREQKLNKIKEILAQGNTYVVLEVKGNTGQHWVAVNGIQGNNVVMMDPGSPYTDLWSRYPWGNTSLLAYYKVTS